MPSSSRAELNSAGAFMLYAMIDLLSCTVLSSRIPDHIADMSIPYPNTIAKGRINICINIALSLKKALISFFATVIISLMVTPHLFRR